MGFRVWVESFWFKVRGSGFGDMLSLNDYTQCCQIVSRKPHYTVPRSPIPMLSFPAHTHRPELETLNPMLQCTTSNEALILKSPNPRP